LHFVYYSRTLSLVKNIYTKALSLVLSALFNID
jgi:hypothetical protein